MFGGGGGAFGAAEGAEGGRGAIGAPGLGAGGRELAVCAEPGLGGVGRREGFFCSSGLVALPPEDDKLNDHQTLEGLVPSGESPVPCVPSVAEDAVVLDVPDGRDDLQVSSGVGREREEGDRVRRRRLHLGGTEGSDPHCRSVCTNAIEAPVAGTLVDLVRRYRVGST